jgi:hypothetical protein
VAQVLLESTQVNLDPGVGRQDTPALDAEYWCGVRHDGSKGCADGGCEKVRRP